MYRSADVDTIDRMLKQRELFADNNIDRSPILVKGWTEQRRENTTLRLTGE